MAAKKNHSIVEIDGFIFPQGLYKQLQLMNEKKYGVKAAASAVLLHLLSTCDQRGFLRGHAISDSSNALGIPYSTVYGGFMFLMEYHFVEERIINGESVYVIADYEAYMNPESRRFGEANDRIHFSEDSSGLNYFKVPHAIFETNIIAELVRTSNGRGMMQLLSLLNSLRVVLHEKQKKHSNGSLNLETVSITINMNTLKSKLHKKAKGVREYLDILSSLFNIKSKGLQIRGQQIWIRQYEISLRQECIREKEDAFEIKPLMAKFEKELTYFLDGINVRHRSKDLLDVMISFKQEVIPLVKYVKDEESEDYRLRDRWLKEYFMATLEQIQGYIQQLQEQNRKVGSIGAVFRIFFRNNLKQRLVELPYHLLHRARYNEFLEKRIPPLPI